MNVNSITFSPQLLLDSLSIVVIDLLLAGDNALVIALAVRHLPKAPRKRGTAAGAAIAVVLRIAITFLAAQLLNVEYVKLVGGLFIIWIAIKVFSDTEAASERGSARGLADAIWMIAVADITMSTDNILAVAGASHGNIVLIIFGLCLSIPFVVLSSNLLTLLIDRYPFVLYIGAAILGKVGAEMIATDPLTMRVLHPTQIWTYVAEVGAMAGIILAGKFLQNRSKRRPGTHAPIP